MKICKCMRCKNFTTEDWQSNKWKCAAFPEGIPEEKLCYLSRDACENCNNGIGFEPIEQNDDKTA